MPAAKTPDPVPDPKIIQIIPAAPQQGGAVSIAAWGLCDDGTVVGLVRAGRSLARLPG